MDSKLTGNQASDFELVDAKGQRIRLSGYGGNKNVVLVFNRSLF
jgi:peroxiredoxin